MSSKKKPLVTYRGETGYFAKDGIRLTDRAALKIWETPGAAHWSQAAYQEMSRRVMK